MKRALLAAALLASLPAMAAEKPAAKLTAPSVSLAKDEDKAAYSIGYFTGKANAQHLE